MEAATIKRLTEYVTSKKGILVREIYLKGGYPVVDIMCANGHRWSTRVRYLLYGKSWCPTCANRTLNIEIMHELAKSRGGWCLSTEYKNSYTKLTWKCHIDAHPPWEATSNSVKDHDSWCRKCRNFGSISEELVRAACIEALPEGGDFENTREAPGLEGNEIDCFSWEYYLAIEVQGNQHTSYNPFFHADESEFKAQQKRDERKRLLCEKEGIIMIEVMHTIPYIEIRPWIRKQLAANLGAHELAPVIMSDEDFYRSVRFDTNRLQAKIEEMNEVLKQRGGSLVLNQQYLGCMVNLQVNCGNGHIFSANWKNVRRAYGPLTKICPVCANAKVKPDARLEKLFGDGVCRPLAIKQGYDYLGCYREERKNRFKLLMCVKCKEAGHEWTVLYDNFNNRDSKGETVKCKYCVPPNNHEYHHGQIPKDLQNITFETWLTSYKLTFLSTSYEGDQKTYAWECSQGHRFADKRRNICWRISRGRNVCFVCKVAERAQPFALFPSLERMHKNTQSNRKKNVIQTTHWCLSCKICGKDDIWMKLEQLTEKDERKDKTVVRKTHAHACPGKLITL